MAEIPRCPQCRAAVAKVTRPIGSPLNNEQFDAIKNGDWICLKCYRTGVLGARRGRYWWDSEVVRND